MQRSLSAVAAGLFVFVAPVLMTATASAGALSIPVTATAEILKSCSVATTSVALDFGSVTLVSGSYTAANAPHASIPVTCTLNTPLSISWLSANAVGSVAGQSPIALSTDLHGVTNSGNVIPYIMYAGVSSVAATTFPNAQFGTDTGVSGGNYVVNIVGNVISGGALPAPDTYSDSENLYFNY